MIDTLKFQIDKGNFDYETLYAQLHEKFEFCGTTMYRHGQSTKFKYKNWQFWLSKNTLKASGSLNKLFHNNNFASFTFPEIKKSLDTLYRVLNLDISEAKITQIDIAYNLEMKHSVNSYFDILFPPTGFKPWKISNETLYFKKNDKAKEIVFYDKAKEVNSKRNIILVDNPNILRYEVKLKKNLGLIIEDALLVNLYNPETYSKLVKFWYDSYVSIPKITQPLSSRIELTSKKSLVSWLINEDVKANGGVEIILNQVKCASLGKSTRYEMRKFLKLNTEVEYQSLELKQELDEKIANACYQQIYSV